MGFASKIVPLVIVVVAAGYAYWIQTPAARSFPFGNLMQTPGFKLEDIPDLSGKIIVVTGGNTGLGKASVRELYHKNAHVILTSRSVSKGNDAAADIKKNTETASGSIEVMELDLERFDSILSFAKEFRKKKLKLHVLMLNAGVMACPYSLTKDGIETQFGVNHVGHFLLTNELMDIVKASAPSRIVVVSSGAHRSAYSYGVGLSLEEINDQSRYTPFGAYGQSKLANIFFARELAKRLEKDGVLVNAIHPGFVSTELTRHMIDSKIIPPFVAKLLPYFAYTPEVAVATQLYAAVGPEIEQKKISGKYIVPVAVLENKFSHSVAEDTSMDSKLWKFTEDLIKSKLK